MKPYTHKPSTITELAGLYGVSRPTFRKWIAPYHKKIGKRIGRYFTIKQVKSIFKILGAPDGISED
jgi:hypothetical protein